MSDPPQPCTWQKILIIINGLFIIKGKLNPSMAWFTLHL